MLPLALRFALRDLRSGLSGLHILVVCVILGVTAIAAIGSLSESVHQGLEREGQPLLGGDIEIALAQRQISSGERSALSSLGTIGEVASLRAMASSATTVSPAPVTSKTSRVSAGNVSGSASRSKSRAQPS